MMSEDSEPKVDMASLPETFTARFKCSKCTKYLRPRIWRAGGAPTPGRAATEGDSPFDKSGGVCFVNVPTPKRTPDSNVDDNHQSNAET